MNTAGHKVFRWEAGMIRLRTGWFVLVVLLVASSCARPAPKASGGVDVGPETADGSDGTDADAKGAESDAGSGWRHSWEDIGVQSLGLCNEPCSEIDGAVTQSDDCIEFGTPPIIGVYGDLYYCYDEEGWLHLLNDWHLRDDAPIPDGCYNLFNLVTGDGAERWEIRVFGSGTMTVLLNDVLVEDTTIKGESAAGFGPSPTNPTDHTIYEFRVRASPGLLLLTECDPPAGPPPAENVCPMVDEPTGFRGALLEGGGAEVEKAPGPIVTSLFPATGGPGDIVVVGGAGFGAGPDGTVLFGSLQAMVTDWTAHDVTVVVPAIKDDAMVSVVVSGAVSNLLEFDAVACEPTCQGKECGPDGCGGSCGSCQDDDDPCTEAPVCDEGTCSYPMVGNCCNMASDCDDDDPCTQDLCDQQLNTCLNTSKLDTGICDDGDPCTAEGCDPASGECTYTFDPSLPGCGDAPCWGNTQAQADAMCFIDPCVVPLCEFANGYEPWTFIYPPDCNTTPQYCGECVNLLPTDCDDNNPCTVDSCEFGIGCVHMLNADEPACFCIETADCLPLISGPCDEVVCLVTEHVCHVSEKECHDYNVCTADSCDPDTGCVYEPLDGAECQDGAGVCVDDLCCVINCQGKECGDDGCGGSCGECGVGCTCTPAGVCAGC